MTTPIHLVSPTLIALIFSLTACSDGATANGNQTEGTTASQISASTSSSSETAPAAPTPSIVPTSPPGPGQILADIYDQKGEGSASYALDDGTVVEFWHGVNFTLSGKHYYTGFADHVSKAGLADGSPQPEMAVRLTTATYVADVVEGKPVWKLFHAQPSDIGSFGAYAKPDAVDQERATQRYVTKAGHLMLAIPTSRLDGGVKSTGYAILFFDPAKSDYMGWQYFGTVPVGEDNSASCDDEGTVKCAASKGALTFVAPKSGTIPMMRVTMQGTVISGPGKIRTLGAADTKTYTYDNRFRHYTPQLLDR
jgi:hypothetical protein